MRHSIAPNKSEELTYRLALSEFLRQAMRTTAAAVPGESDICFAEIIKEGGAILGVAEISHWKREVDTTWTHRPYFTNTAKGSSNDDDVAALHPLLLVTHFDGLVGPTVFSDVDPAIGKCTRLLIPALRAGEIMCVLAFTRHADRPWLEHEIAACAELTSVLFATRERLNIEAQLAACFYDAPLGMTLRSLDGSLIDCNQAFVDFLGRDTEADMLNHGGVELLASEELTPAMLEVLANPEPNGYNGLELPYRHASGKVVWGRLSVASIQCEEVLLWLTHIEDVSVERAERELNAERATRDSVTGLANRHMLIDRLKADLTSTPIELGSPINAIVLFDLNGFKEVNDTYGHQTGDLLLQQLGQRLSSQLRSSDLIARYGGDEFVVVLSGPLTEHDAQQRCADFREALVAPVRIGDHTFHLQAALGLAMGTPGMSPDELISVADAAMYRDKPKRPSAR